MLTPTITNMNPGEIMKKRPFRRFIPSASLTALSNGFSLSPTAIEGTIAYEYPTYADFAREQSVTGHKIMSTVYYPDITGYDEDKKRFYTRKVARVTTNLPAVFASQRTSMLTGDHVDLKLLSGGESQENQDLLSEFMEGWDYKDMEKAVYDIISYSFQYVDSAVVFFMNGNEVGWRSMAYPKGDVIYPHYDSFGRLSLFGRKYKGWDGEKEIEYLDVYDDTSYMRYRMADAGEIGKDGLLVWKIDQEPVPHGFNRCPVVYHRGEDTVAGPAMNILDNFDLAMSQLCENNKHYALRIFYALGSDVDISASLDGRPMTVTSTDSNSKVGFLEPAEASGSFELQMRQLIKSAYQAAHCTEPVEIKSGADISSLTVQMMSKDSYHRALLDAKDFQPAINGLVELFKYGYAKERGKSSKYENLLIKGTINPYIMRSEVEEVNNISILKGTGALPIKAAANEAAKLGYGTPRNYEDLLQEEHDRLMLEQTAQAQVQPTEVIETVNSIRNQ